MKEIFREIGLTEAEQKVYLALLDLGEATRGEIVDTSGVAGSKIYELLHKLQQKGLVSNYTQNKVKHFKPTHPTQIIEYLEQKKMALQQMETQATSILPLLIEKFQSSKKEQEVELLSGLRGLEIIFREQVEMMKKGDVCYVIGGTWGENEEVMQSFFQKIHRMREEKGIQTKMLFNKRQKRTTEHLYSKKTFSKTSTKYIDHASPVAINTYKDRTIIIIFGRQITAIHIKSEEVARSFLEYFNILWAQAGKPS